MRKRASRRKQETHSLQRSGIQRGETRCDKTKGATHTIFVCIFIDKSCRSINGIGMIFLPLEKLMTGLTGSWSWWPDVHDIKVIFERMMEHLNGESCYLCEDLDAQKWTKQTWLNHSEKGSNKKRPQIAQTRTVTFFTCVLSKATLEGTKLILHCKIVEIPCNWIEYHSAENQFERFRQFLELISRFEFDFRRCAKFFLMILIFGVFGIQLHSMWLVCTRTIPFRMLLCPWWFTTTYIYMQFF